MQLEIAVWKILSVSCLKVKYENAFLKLFCVPCLNVKCQFRNVDGFISKWQMLLIIAAWKTYCFIFKSLKMSLKNVNMNLQFIPYLMSNTHLFGY